MTLPLAIRLMAKMRVSDEGCWVWQGWGNPDGYGRLSVDGKLQQAHRVSWRYFVGPIPADREIDHRCNNPRCINPYHLQLATRRENVLRGNGMGARNARKTHCKRGHPLAGENLYLTPETGRRVCRICRREQGRERMRQWRAARSAA